MPETQTTRREVPVFGILLLFLGIVFLLQTLGALPWGLWRVLWRYWPVLLIIAGLAILLRRYNPWLVSGAILVVLVASLGAAIGQYGGLAAATPVERSYSEPLGSLQRAEVNVRFSAGELDLAGLPPTSADLVRVDGPAGVRGIRADLRRQDGEGKLSLAFEGAAVPFTGAGGRWDVRLTGKIPIAADIRTAAANGRLDLKDLRIGELRLEVDAGNLDVTVPVAGVTRARVRANMSNVEITVPDGVAARIKADATLSSVEIDGRRFPEQGGYYQSRDFDSAADRIDLNVECNLGSVRVR